MQVAYLLYDRGILGEPAEAPAQKRASASLGGALPASTTGRPLFRAAASGRALEVDLAQETEPKELAVVIVPAVYR